jgi:thiol-disulfide isomerase/thioredoxin
MKKSIAVLAICLYSFFSAQENKCGISKSEFDISRVNVEDIKCLAQNSNNKKSIFFTFARWCGPCMYHLPQYLALEKNYDVDLYVLLIDPEGSKMTQLAKDYVLEDFPNAKIVILKDGKGGKNRNYKDFLNEITPKKFEVIRDMSKYIVLNKQGEVELVTNWKDGKDDPDWRDDQPMIDRLVIPLLEKK